MQGMVSTANKWSKVEHKRNRGIYNGTLYRTLESKTEASTIVLNEINIRDKTTN